MTENCEPAGRLIFVNRFFYPDESATSLMLSDLVFGLPRFNRQVITSRSHYAGAKANREKPEMIKGVAVHRMPSAPFSQNSMLGKVFNFLVFYVMSFCAVLKQARRGDKVICLTDPPLGNLVCIVAAKLKGAQLINWVQDIYPETATRLGVGSASNPLVWLITRLRDFAWHAADANVVIGGQMKAFVQGKNPRGKVPLTIQNWTDEEQLAPLSIAENTLRRDWGYEPRDCVVGYSGNLGRAHDYKTMSAVIRKAADAGSNRLRFLFIGGGMGLEKLKSRTSDLTTIAIQPYQPRSDLRRSLSIPDIHWLSLAPQLEGLIVPSKFYGAAAVGRPIIFIGDPKGEVAELIGRAQCGQAFRPDDVEGLTEYLLELEQSATLRSNLGRNARSYVEAELRRETRIDEWRQLLASNLDHRQNSGTQEGSATEAVA